MSVRCVRE